MTQNQVIEEFQKISFEKKLFLRGLPPGHESLPTNPADFLFNFFTKYNLENYTIDEFDVVITGPYRRRSVQEVFAITQNYFPNYEIIQFLKDFYSVLYRVWVDKDLNTANKFLSFHWCSDIKRPVIFLCTDKKLYTTTDADRFTLKPNKYFPFNVRWKPGNGYPENFWCAFSDEEFAGELIGSKYLEVLAAK